MYFTYGVTLLRVLMTKSVECKCGGVKARIRRDSFGMCKSPCLLHNRFQMIQLNYKTTKQSFYQGFSSRFLQNQTFFYLVCFVFLFQTT